MNNKQRYVFIALIGLAILAFLAVQIKPWENFGPQHTPKKIPEENYAPTFTKEGELWIVQEQDTLAFVDIEIAEDPAERSYGMMYRKEMDPNTGMLFIMDREQRQSFYMKNTYVPLDILYINSAKEIVDIKHNAKPLDESSLPSDRPAKYVLELYGGYCNQNGIAEGAMIDFERL